MSFFALTEFWGENSVSSSQPIICVTKRTHRVLHRTHRVCPKTQWVLFSDAVLLRQYSPVSYKVFHRRSFTVLHPQFQTQFHTHNFTHFCNENLQAWPRWSVRQGHDRGNPQKLPRTPAEPCIALQNLKKVVWIILFDDSKAFSKEKGPFLHGKGASGKSIFKEALHVDLSSTTSKDRRSKLLTSHIYPSKKGNGTNRTGGSTILKLVWGGSMLHFLGCVDLQPYEI